MSSSDKEDTPGYGSPVAEFPASLIASPEDCGKRLDQFLVAHVPDISRARVQQWIAQQKVLVNGTPGKSSLRLRGGEQITLIDLPAPDPLRAIAEDIPLKVIYEDEDLAVIEKPAGMMVHAGAGATDSDRNRGTVVNALLHRFGALSTVSGVLRPGIVHRLDRNTSGLLVVAKNDRAHRKLAAQFARRQVRKTYIALVHGWLKRSQGSIKSAISRDLLRRTRMTTRRAGGREAVSHYRVVEQIDSDYGRFSLLEVAIETGRTHQIRVHLSSIGHPVVGDTLYGAAGNITPEPAHRQPGRRRGARTPTAPSTPAVLSLPRHFLHAAQIAFQHPHTGQALAFSSPIPEELAEFLARLKETSHK
ncbi:MAG TPA: RluA family pseudouridine synthase [Terriglobales bacterium]|nr:RluA family pseudouridine synthase [Terriglobales bacterium]